MRQGDLLRHLLPTPGNVIFLLMILVGLFAANRFGAPTRLGTATSPSLAAASATSTTTVPYQGRLTDANGNPLNGTYPMTFNLYNAPSGGPALWTENWTSSSSVPVNNGLFNVLLGSLNPIPLGLVTGTSSLWLGIAVGTDPEMSPRVQIGSVPYALQALTVPNGSIGTAQLGDAAVTSRNFKPTTARLQSTADLNLTTSYQNIPGLTFTFAPGTNSTVLVWLTIDFDGNGSAAPGDVGVGGVNIDGVALSTQAILEFTSAYTRATVSQTYYAADLMGGVSHTISASARNNGGNRGVTRRDHSSITILVVGQ